MLCNYGFNAKNGICLCMCVCVCTWRENMQLKLENILHNNCAHTNHTSVWPFIIFCSFFFVFYSIQNSMLYCQNISIFDEILPKQLTNPTDIANVVAKIRDSLKAWGGQNACHSIRIRMRNGIIAKPGSAKRYAKNVPTSIKEKKVKCVDARYRKSKWFCRHSYSKLKNSNRSRT